MESITNDDRNVLALAIDNHTIYVECKAKNWKKCGNRMGYHVHGNAGNLGNREEGRASHCCYGYNNIIIDCSTFRGKLVKRIKEGWRKDTLIFERRF